MQNNKKTARIAGLLYLMVIVFGVFAELYVRSNIIVSGHATETVSQIIANQHLFRWGFISDLLMQVSFFFLSLILYQLLKRIHQGYASLMVLCVMVSVAIMCLNMLHQFAAILILEKGYFINVFNTDQINALVSFFLDLQKYGYRIAQIFFGLWLFPLGYLVYKSGFLPKIIGALLIIACFSFLLDFFLFFLLTNYSAALSSMITLPTTIGEFSICLYLLIKGVK